MGTSITTVSARARRLAGLAAALALFGGALAAPRAATGPIDQLVAQSHDYLLASTRLSTAHTWSGRFDRLLASAGAARGLDARWNATDPRWQKARAGLLKRVADLHQALAAQGKLDSVMAEQLARVLKPDEARDLVQRLGEPVGLAFLRNQSASHFIVSALDTGPNAPRPGNPEWLRQMAELRKAFDAGFGLPAPPAAATADMVAFGKLPAAVSFGRAFAASARSFDTAVNNAVNLMLFDERQAIDREIDATLGR